MANSYIGRYDLPPGLRNNNPGNIRPGEAWQGKIGEVGGFIVFQDVSWGLRALATDLINKIREGVNTITAIVTKYAPASDNNNVASYIAAVAQDSGIGPNDLLSVDQVTIHDLMRAIVDHELGGEYAGYITDQDIDQGISMINPSLGQLFQAATIAVTSTVANTSGTAWLAVGLGALLLYQLSKEK